MKRENLPLVFGLFDVYVALPLWLAALICFRLAGTRTLELQFVESHPPLAIFGCFLLVVSATAVLREPFVVRPDRWTRVATLRLARVVFALVILISTAKLASVWGAWTTDVRYNVSQTDLIVMCVALTLPLCILNFRWWWAPSLGLVACAVVPVNPVASLLQVITASVNMHMAGAIAAAAAFAYLAWGDKVARKSFLSCDSSD